MDTVTEAELAIALARTGGLGVIHRNCSIEEQVAMLRAVKRAEAFIIYDVITITPDQTVKEAIELMERHNIHGLPVVDKNEKLVGIITGRDVRFAEHSLKVSDVMSKDVQTADEDITIEKAKEILHAHRIEKLPIVNEKGHIIGLITMKDLMLRGKYPNAARDEEGRILCAAAISPFDEKRVEELEKANVDIIVIDVAHVHNANCFKAIKSILKNTNMEIVIGNLGTYEGAVDALTQLDGIAGLRVGIGSGSICTTSVVTRAGSPTLYATLSAADACLELGVKDVPIIADGGIRNPGDIAVAIAAGASCVMMGNIFAGTRESPGHLITLEGRYYKEYRGMASHAAKRKLYAMDRYPAKAIAEGVEGYVPYRGTVEDVVTEFVSGLKATMGYVGARNIKEIWEKGKFGVLTQAGIRETRPHDIFMPTRRFGDNEI